MNHVGCHWQLAPSSHECKKSIRGDNQLACQVLTCDYCTFVFSVELGWPFFCKLPVINAQLLLISPPCMYLIIPAYCDIYSRNIAVQHCLTSMLLVGPMFSQKGIHCCVNTWWECDCLSVLIRYPTFQTHSPFRYCFHIASTLVSTLIQQLVLQESPSHKCTIFWACECLFFGFYNLVHSNPWGTQDEITTFNPLVLPRAPMLLLFEVHLMSL